jgi:hypothetical protein
VDHTGPFRGPRAPKRVGTDARERGHAQAGQGVLDPLQRLVGDEIQGGEEQHDQDQGRRHTLRSTTVTQRSMNEPIGGAAHAALR